MRTHVIELMNARHTIEETRQKIANLEEGLLSDPRFVEFRELEGQLSAAKAAERNAKSAVGQAMIDAYLRDGEKKYPGVGQVKISKVIEYDQAKAVSWCVQSGMQHLLTLAPAFDDVAKGLAGAVDWCESKDKPTASVSSKVTLE